MEDFFRGNYSVSSQAEQADNVNRSATTILTVTIFEINLFRPTFLNTPYRLVGYTTYNTLDHIPTLNGSVSDNDTVSEME